MKAIRTSNQKGQRSTRKLELICITAGVLAAGQVRGQITLTINDLSDGSPVVNLSDLTVGANVSTVFEEATVIFSNFIGVPTGTMSSILLEPSSDPNGPQDSDYVTLTVDGNHTVTVFFASDGAADYNKNFPPAGTPTMLETGSPQLMFPGIGLQVFVSSDLGGTEDPVPDAASTIGCLGLALTALAAFGRRIGLNPFRVC
jgi:hypothetical protein